jgi:acetyl esterase/lipase
MLHCLYLNLSGKLTRRLSHYLQLVLASMLLLLPASAWSQMTTHTGIAFANTGERDLLLDLYLPEGVSQAPLIVWLHGGAWRAGGKENVEANAIVEHGFAVASIGFRNSGEATFPAQIHDIKAAVRFLRAQAAQYGYDASSIAVWGVSSGGHLAALTGVSNGSAALEGSLGDHLGESSDVQAIVDYSGPANLRTILHQSTPHGVGVRAPAMEALLGKPVEDESIQDLVTLASPALQVSASAPPLLVMHGVQDNQVPINQAIELQLAYEAAGAHVEAEWILQATHGSGEYFRSPYLEQVVEFLKRTL